MSLQDVSTELLLESLLALADLRRKYNGEPQVTRYAGKPGAECCASDRCPLCLFDRLHNNGVRRCLREADAICDCPWEWIGGHNCEEWKEKWIDENGVHYSERSYSDYSEEERLARIARWTEAITAEIESRGGR